MSFARLSKEKSLRQQLTIGSIWKFTERTELKNIKINPEIVASWQASIKPDVSDASNRALTVQEIIAIADKNQLFTVVAKHKTSTFENKLISSICLNQQTIEVMTDCLRNKIEKVSSPEDLFYCIYDPVSDQYFKKTSHNCLNYVLTPRVSSARKYAKLSQVKAAILSFTGYHEGMPTEFGVPDWLSGPKLFDLPESWQVLRLEDQSLDVTETVDIQAWYRQTWRLREIAKKYGASVKKIFDLIENDDSSIKFTGLLVFQRSREMYSWNDSIALNPKDKKDIDNAMDSASLDKEDYIRTIDKKSVVYAFKQPQMALIVKMAYIGKFKVVALDLNMLKEVVK
jgi:hypothetical protein